MKGWTSKPVYDDYLQGLFRKLEKFPSVFFL
jgi:hypothetical protein